VSDAFATRALALTPNFDLTNSLIELEFVRQVENLMVDMGDMKIAPQQHSLIVTAWIKMWNVDRPPKSAGTMEIVER
jgi:hypothetical protein